MRSINLLHRTQSTSQFTKLKQLVWHRGKWVVVFYLFLFFPVMTVSVWIEYQTKTTQQQQQELRAALAQLNTVETRARQLKSRIAQIGVITTPKIEMADALKEIIKQISIEGISIGTITIEQTGQVQIHAVAAESALLQDLEQKLVDFGTKKELASIDVSGVTYETTNRQYALDIVLNLY